MSRTPHVAVIGAGLAGLATAAHLRRAGYEVTIVEAAEHAGGLVRTETIGGHQFDTGATVLTMPGLLVDVLHAVGVDESRARELLALRPVDPGYVMNYADGTSLALPHDASAIPDAVGEVFGPAARQGVFDLLTWTRRIYDAEFDTFIDRNFDGLTDLTSSATRRAATELLRLGALGGLTGAVSKFIADERLQRAFTFQALYAGVPPHRARAIYAVISDMDIGRGVSTPVGGMGHIGEVLATALLEAGVTIHLSTQATSLRRDSSDRIRSVLTTGGEIAVDAVVATAERDNIAQLAGAPVPSRTLRYSPSAVVIHGVLDAGVTDRWTSGHHTLDFGTAWTQTFAEITARSGRLMTDGSFLITRGAASDATTFVAGGRESVSVLAPAPNLESADLPWDVLDEPYAREVLATLEARGYAGIANLQIARIDHPRTWAQAGLPAGTPFSAAHTVSQTGPLRTPNRWPGINNLFVAGSATTPGIGIPPVLISGGLAAERVKRLLGANVRGGRHV